MYLKIHGDGQDTLYIDMPERPNMSVNYDYEEDIWLAAVILPTQILVLKSGTSSECHEVVNKILLTLNLIPETL